MSTLGSQGEQAAVEYLQQNGYTILARNYHTRGGEIDIICANDRFLVFVEVKTRSSSRFGTPAEAVTWQKQQKIIRTAQIWLMQHPCALQPRFDVAEVYAMRNGKLCVHLLENAFEVS